MRTEQFSRAGTRPRRTQDGLRALAVALAATVGGAVHSAAQTNPVDANLEVLSNWVEARKELATAETNWQGEKVRLLDMIELRKTQLTQLNEGIENMREATDAAERERTELGAGLEGIRQVEEQVDAAVTAAEARMRTLVHQLPHPLQQELQPLIVRLPNPAERGGNRHALSSSQRMQTIVGLLTQIEKFNDTVEVSQEARDIDGRRMQVETLYFGLAQAYWVDGNGSAGGTGHPGPDGWVWQRDDALAPQISTLIAMYRNTASSFNYVSLPVQVAD